MRSLIGILLIVGGIVLGYFGYNKLNDNKADVKIGDLEITAKDGSNTTAAWTMIGGGVIALIAGALTLGKKTS